MIILIFILFGLVQGVTEWLPISSTGHLILLNYLIGNESTINPEFFEFFLVIVQLASIFAVIILFINDLNPLASSNSQIKRKETFLLWTKVLIACIPIGISGFLIEDIVNNYFIIITMLVLFGLIFIVVENINKNKDFKVNNVQEITYKMALIIGIIQLIALVPGTSRSGVTIIGAMLLGINRTTSAKFSFFLSIPVMFGASLLEGIRFFINNSITINEVVYLLIGGITAFAVSLLVIKFLLNYIKKHNFKVFGYYRIILGLTLLLVTLFI